MEIDEMCFDYIIINASTGSEAVAKAYTCPLMWDFYDDTMEEKNML